MLCVFRWANPAQAPTRSARADDQYLLGIPRSREIIASPDPNHEGFSPDYPAPFEPKQNPHADSFSVARVQPRTSKGITDLLLLFFMQLSTACPSKKSRSDSRGPTYYLVRQSLVGYWN